MKARSSSIEVILMKSCFKKLRRVQGGETAKGKARRTWLMHIAFVGGRPFAQAAFPQNWAAVAPEYCCPKRLGTIFTTSVCIPICFHGWREYASQLRTYHEQSSNTRVGPKNGAIFRPRFEVGNWPQLGHWRRVGASAHRRWRCACVASSPLASLHLCLFSSTN